MARRRPWYKKKRFVIPGALVALLVLPAALNGGDGASSIGAAPAATASVAASAPAATRAPEPVRTTTAPPAPKDYAAISARDFKLLAKDPDAYAGKAYTIYGYVSQFDSATGTGGFRANTGATKQKADDWYEFEQNSVLTGDEDVLAVIVEDDLFQAKVVVTGSYSYDTQIGGSTTVPSFAVQEITVYGSKS